MASITRGAMLAGITAGDFVWSACRSLRELLDKLRPRRENFYAAGLWLWLSIRDGSWMGKRHLPVVNDDQAILSALSELWGHVWKDYPRGVMIFRIGVTLYDLSPSHERQLDLLLNDDRQRRRWENASKAIDLARDTIFQTTSSSVGLGFHPQ
ncbi:hypothetical protein LJR235_005014 [Pararhizobium sp. LjRoot235]